jgi:hypothetical protein
MVPTYAAPTQYKGVGPSRVWVGGILPKFPRVVSVGGANICCNTRAWDQAKYRWVVYFQNFHALSQSLGPTFAVVQRRGTKHIICGWYAPKISTICVIGRAHEGRSGRLLIPTILTIMQPIKHVHLSFSFLFLPVSKLEMNEGARNR